MDMGNILDYLLSVVLCFGAFVRFVRFVGWFVRSLVVVVWSSAIYVYLEIIANDFFTVVYNCTQYLSGYFWLCL